MTIRKGEDWGSEAPLPDGTEICPDDAAVLRAINNSNPPNCLGLVSGDLARTVAASGRPDRFAPGSTVVLMPIDLGELTIDGRTRRFASHVVLRRSWLRGPVVVIANAQFIGHWDVAPRSHPNDGWLDVTEVSPSMTLRQRLAARKRLPTAGHLPHPAIQTTRVRERDWSFERPLNVWVDGQRVGSARHLAVRCLPDALTICI